MKRGGGADTTRAGTALLQVARLGCEGAITCRPFQRQCCGSEIIYRIRIRDYNFGSGSDMLQFSVTEIAGNLLSTQFFPSILQRTKKFTGGL